MLIGTAGHIDHGKTTLLKALTGVDTDRLPEEKRRGISIDLGYAYLSLPGEPDRSIGFIDVPGHEKFVPTMLAGATAIDFALLVVAADDGPMPQTREHLQILDLLGIRRGCVALTKCDRVDAARVEAAVGEVRALLAPTQLAGAPVFPVAAVRGQGIAALRDHLFAAARDESAAEAPGGFRLAVDRAFALAGAGTVVTGTVHAGRVRVGDRLAVQPAGTEVRVRSLHVQNRQAEEGRIGQRCALALVGVDHREVGRGDWICAIGVGRPASRVDVRLRLSAEAPRRLAHWSAVHVHHGAGHATGRVALLDAGLEAAGLAPGQEALAQIVVDSPLCPCRGDLVVVRDASGRATLGGGRVLDPFGSARRRRSPERLATLAALEVDDPVGRIGALLDAAGAGVDLDLLAAATNRDVVADLAALGGERAVVPERLGLATSRERWDAWGVAVTARLAAYHEDSPDEFGVERERLRRMALPEVGPALFAARLDALRAAGEVVSRGSLWHLPSHRVELDPREARLAEAIAPMLAERPFDPPWVRDVAAAAAVPEADVRTLLRKLAARGEAFQVVRDLFYAPAAVGRLADTVAGLAASDGRVRASAFRDRIGVGRKRAIQILEFFDRVGYTRRVGAGGDAAHVVRGEPPAAG